jgi:hypothetical protein
MEPTIFLRLAELTRRVNALPAELDAWKDRTVNGLAGDRNLYNANFSQVQTVDALLRAGVAGQLTLVGQLETAPSAVAFTDAAWTLTQQVIEAHRVWDYFREKLNQRLVPELRGGLWLADTVAWDCYRPVMDQAAVFGAVRVEDFREPPLTYFMAEFSPYTYARNARPPHEGRPNALGSDRLPIPVIGMPWDHLPNPWEFVYLAHEVAHDLETDQQLFTPLAGALADALTNAKVPADRAACWKAWQKEVFADLVALRQVGPAYADGLAHILLLPPGKVVTDPRAGTYPPYYLRIQMNVAYARTLVNGLKELNDHADELWASWEKVYGAQPQYKPYTDDFGAVFDALMNTPPAKAWAKKTVTELIPFTEAADAQIRLAANYLRTGQGPPAAVRPRYGVAAARLAATKAAADADQKALADALAGISTRTAEVVRNNAPAGLRGSGKNVNARNIAKYGKSLGLTTDAPPAGREPGQPGEGGRDGENP